ncbi:MAG: TlpA family protein disulfide reductase [bacterium]
MKVLFCAAAALICCAAAADALEPGSRIGNVKVRRGDGKEVEISKIKRDNVAVLAFWMPQSPAARREVEKLHSFIRGRNAGTVMILVSKGKDEADKRAAEQAAREMGVGSEVYFDPDLAAVKNLDVKSVPWFIAVARDGAALSPGFNTIEKKFRNLTIEQIFSLAESGGEIPFHEFVPVKEGDGTRELIGARAPDFDARDLRGNAQSPAKYRGRKPLFIVFWRESCPHCRNEMPKLAEFYMRLREKMGFEILGVAITGNPEDEEKTRKYVAEQTIVFPIVLDGGGKISAKYSLASVPAIFYVDKKGIVRETQIGETEQLDGLLLSFLKIQP